MSRSCLNILYLLNKKYIFKKVFITVSSTKLIFTPCVKHFINDKLLEISSFEIIYLHKRIFCHWIRFNVWCLTKNFRNVPKYKYTLKFLFFFRDTFQNLHLIIYRKNIWKRSHFIHSFLKCAFLALKNIYTFLSTVSFYSFSCQYWNFKHR